MADFGDLDGLMDGLANGANVLSSFNAEMDNLQSSTARAQEHVAVLEKGLSGGLRKAFDGLAMDGFKLSDALKVVATSVANTAYNAAVAPVTKHFGSVIAQGIGGMFGGAFANGGVMSQGRVQAFAKGGVIDSPTGFPMRGGTGLMGEAGPEAIMPLPRGADGKLGVKSAGGGRAVTVNMNITTPDVQGFQRSQSQVAAQMSRALSRGQRNA